MRFFSPDSKFFQFMTAVAEMMLLNVCWIIASLPLITMGAANIAMYTIIGRWLRQESSGTVTPFFQAWWRNLKQGILFWVVQLFVTCSLGMILFLPLPTALKVIAVIFLILVTLTFSTIYPQIARFRNRRFAYLRNAVFLLALKPGRVLLNSVVLLLPVILFLLVPVETLRFGFVWILFGFSILFYLSARIMQKVFLPLEEISAKKRRRLP